MFSKVSVTWAFYLRNTWRWQRKKNKQTCWLKWIHTANLDIEAQIRSFYAKRVRVDDILWWKKPKKLSAIAILHLSVSLICYCGQSSGTLFISRPKNTETNRLICGLSVISWRITQKIYSASDTYSFLSTHISLLKHFDLCKNARERFPLALCTLKNKKNTVSVPLTSICSCLESTNGPSCGRETRNRKTRQNTESWEDWLPHRYTPDSVYVSFSGNSVMDSVCFMMEQQGRLYQQADIRTIPDNNID